MALSDAEQKDLYRRVKNADENFLHHTLKGDPVQRYLVGDTEYAEAPNWLVNTINELMSEVRALRVQVTDLINQGRNE